MPAARRDAAIPHIPIATYRLQFRQGMTFDRAIGLIPHLSSLGISHLYASPVFTAVSGSTHGYDVTDPNELDPDLGGMLGFRRLSDALMKAGIGLVLDIVPNHMAASLENEHWRSVLKWGRRSPSAPIFDNDWDRQLTLPVLTGPLREEIEAGHGLLTWSGGARELVFDYRGSLYPLDPATYAGAFEQQYAPPHLDAFAAAASPGDGTILEELLAAHFRAFPVANALLSRPADIVELIERQPWRMIHWRDAAKDSSYRRFFEIAGLVGVRVEDEAVFDATHRLVLDLVAEGRVQGLRIDHIDGLADPAGYLDRLRQAVGPNVYLVVEKILEGDEELPPSWPVQGTTGYEFIADLAGVLTADSPELDRAWRDGAPELADPEQGLEQAKRLMVEVNFEGEVTGLVKRAVAISIHAGASDVSETMLAEAVRALVAGFEVYRTYGTAEGLTAQDEHVLHELFERLAHKDPGLRPAVALLADILFQRVPEDCQSAALMFRTRLQHLTGPVLAKSLEDTFFYRYNRLIALNEVGGNPVARPLGINHFHRRMSERQARQPHALSATSTHDTKRGEDARARLYAISEAPVTWVALVAEWRKQLAQHVTTLPDGDAPEPAVEWLLFQALAGMLPPDFDPADAESRSAIVERVTPYVEKALREAKLRSNWSDVNEPYETAVKNYATAAIRSEEFMTGFWRDIRPFVATGMINSLTQTLLKLTAPGIPDIYQGTEGWDTSLVDPDNRRLPDHDALMAMRNEPSDVMARKAWMISTVMQIRRRYVELFADGDYVPLRATGARSDHAVAFARSLGGRSVIVVVPRLVHQAVNAGTLQSREYWADTCVVLPNEFGAARDVFADGDPVRFEGRVLVADLFQARPFALLLA